ncbi:predicted protein [Chaetoceros tenuissimus]|uniref:Uncharacterized protein n=1 Tax=Chaetoceros tenuissimus TaxID=426638 RepID=A0AAD3CN55_9STRA|nr:predicted protein [Chaetoceros tenuissimus]
MNLRIEDIEQGSNGTNTNCCSGTTCCCDTRIAGITLFSISLLLETVALIWVFIFGAIWFGTIIDFAFLLLTIIGLRGCAMIDKSMAKAGQVGYIIKAALLAIGIIFFILVWFTIDLPEYFDTEFFAGALAASVVYFIFNVVGALVVEKYVKEIDSGRFMPINTE